ncbi:MAG: hypothetical protein KAR06_04205 [Deltaproteobacteria bacterium]|nr:hypothetical protein [Deltaproteobacteria bacterium]
MTNNTESRNLSVKLTEGEILDYSNTLAKTNMDLAATEDRKTTATAAFGHEIKRHKAEINILSHKVATREEYRDVECEWEFDFVEGKKTLYRTDTGEQVESAPINDYDRQMKMGGTDADPVEPDSVETCDGAEENHEDAGGTSSEDSASAE